MAKPAGLPKAGADEFARMDMLSVREAAALLGVHEHTVRAWVRKGIVRAIRLPGSNYSRFKVEEIRRIRRLMEEGKGGSGVRIELPRTDPESLEEAHRLSREVKEELAQNPPEEGLEEVMTRLRGRRWSS